MEIKTNNQPRDLLSGYELDVKIWVDEFDYYTYDELMECVDQFFQYKGEWYDIGEFERVPVFADNKWEYWDGIQHDSFFSGIVVKYTEDAEGVIVGRYCT